MSRTSEEEERKRKDRQCCLALLRLWAIVGCVRQQEREKPRDREESEESAGAIMP